MSRHPEPSETARDVQPLAEAPPADVQNAPAEWLLRTWKTPTGWRYWSSVTVAVIAGFPLVA